MPVKTKIKGLWMGLSTEIKREILSVIIKEQEVFTEALYLSCLKHGIGQEQFLTELQKHPDLFEAYQLTQYKIGKLGNVELSKMGLSTLYEILTTDHTEKIEYKYENNNWVPTKKTKIPNIENRLLVSKFLLERLHIDYNPRIKEIQVSTALDILKTLSQSKTVRPEDVENIQTMLSNYLRNKGIDIKSDISIDSQLEDF
jgi:hypothetical protein